MKAILVANAEDYLWSSAARKAEMTLGSAGPTACATFLESIGPLARGNSIAGLDPILVEADVLDGLTLGNRPWLE